MTSDEGHILSFDAYRNTNQHPSSLLGFRFTFAQGFLAGQLSVIIIALFAIRYIIFEDSKSSQKRTKNTSHIPLRTLKNRKNGFLTSNSTLRKNVSISAQIKERESDVPRIMADIMNKVQYEMDSHPSESIDWINVIIAQALAGYRQDIQAGGWSYDHDMKRSQDGKPPRPFDDRKGGEGENLQRTARDWMEEILNLNTLGRGMTFLDPIQVTQVEFGNAYPIFSNAKVRPADDMGRMRIEVDVDYTDCMSLAIETKLLINFPRPRFAILPVSLGLTIERFSGTMAIELFSNSSNEASFILPTTAKIEPPRSRHELHFSLHPDFTLDATASSLVGSRAKLQDLPKIEQLLVGRVRTYIHDRFVWPKYWTLTLPNLIPRHTQKEHAVDERDSVLHHHRPQNDSGGFHTNADRHLSAQDDDQKTAHVQGVGEMLTKQGNAHENEEQRQSTFFETAPPLFTGILHPSPHSDQALPGGLPSVEAWRSHAAASGAGSASATGRSLRNRTQGQNSDQPDKNK